MQAINGGFVFGRLKGLIGVVSRVGMPLFSMFKSPSELLVKNGIGVPLASTMEMSAIAM